MSPAPQGNLEVERYIGSCLISQRASTNNQCHRSYHPKPNKTNDVVVENRGRYSVRVPADYGQHRSHGGWTGLPLISMTAGNPRRGKKQNKSTKPQNSCADGENQNFDNTRSPFTRLAIHTQGAPLIQAGRFANHNRSKNVSQSGEASKSNSDNLSVASDESSANSENSLPRIIKPRKRRKKDRKPPTSTERSDGSPIVTLQPYMPLCFESFSARATSESKPQDLIKEEYVKPYSDNDASVEDLLNRPNSTDEFIFGNVLNDDDVPTTLCQCRYCDPSGVIWDVDQRCYSPFLTPPSPTDSRFLQYSKYYDSTPFFAYSSVLRRSWSDPASNNDVNASEKNTSPSPQVLQVSSEIVTSPNGHRDIEIKFYSSASSITDKNRELIAEE